MLSTAIQEPISLAMMANGQNANEFVITSAGEFAFEAIDYPKHGRVAAVFDHSFYIELAGDWICFGASSLTLGPLNMRTDAPPNINWQASGLQLEDPVRISATQIHIGNLFAFSYRDAQTWRPDITTCPDIPIVSAGLVRLADRALSMAPTEGLASFIFPDGAKNTTLPAAALSIGKMKQFVQCGSNDQATIRDPVTTLIGMGPGLTPSGDDYLGGMMIALQVLGEEEKSACLARAIEEVAPATNDISRAHLKAAAQGVGAEPLHATINNVIADQGQNLGTSLKRLDTIGHCSGWDALTGVVTTLRSWLE